MNEKRSRNRDRPKPYQDERAKTPKAVNTVSGDKARDSRPQNNKEELDRAANTEQPPKPVNYTHTN